MRPSDVFRSVLQTHRSLRSTPFKVYGSDLMSGLTKEQTRMNKFKLSMTALLALGMTASMCAQNGQSKKSLKVLGTTRIGNAKKVATESGNEVLTGPEVDVTTAKPQISGTTSPARVPSAHVPNPTGNALITAAGSNFVGFNGLTHRDQRLSNNGNQFSLEPPDQGLAVSGGYVVEAVNDAVAVYDRSGTL